MPAIFKGNEVSPLHMTNFGGGERAFRLVQEAYCGWLRKQVADLQSNKMVHKEQANAN